MAEMPGLITGFLSSYGQMAALRQKQIQDTVDQEMAQQRFDQQNAAQQSLDTYHQGMLNKYAQDLQERQAHNVALEQQRQEDQRRLEENASQKDLKDKNTLFKSTYNTNVNQNRMDVRPAMDSAAAMAGMQVPQGFREAQMAGAGWSPHDIPAQPGPAAAAEGPGAQPGTVGNIGGQLIPMLGMPAPEPPMGTLLVPGSQAYMDRQKALDEASKARANLQRVQADRLQQLAPLDAEYEQAKIDLANLQQDWGAQRIAIAKSNSIARQIYDGEQINLAKARNNIAIINTRIRSAELQNRVDTQALIDARQHRQLISSDLGHIQSEASRLSGIVDKNDKIAKLAAQTAQGYAESGDTSSKEYMVASNMAQSMTREVASQKARLRALNIRADKYRDTLNLIPGQTPITSSGSPVGPPALVPRGGSLPPLKNLGMAFEGPAKVAPPATPVRKQFYDKQGTAKWFRLNKGQWVPE